MTFRKVDIIFVVLALLVVGGVPLLPSPRDPSGPLVFTDEQALQLVEWYRVDPTTGRRVVIGGQQVLERGRAVGSRQDAGH